MSVVYAVSNGCYSDYDVERVFELREDAERFVTAMGGDADDSDCGPRVEEFEFHPAGTMPVVYTEFWARAWPDRDRELEHGSNKTTYEPVFSVRADDRFIYVTGPDRERVIKSASDRLAAARARLEGIS